MAFKRHPRTRGEAAMNLEPLGCWRMGTRVRKIKGSRW